MDMREWWWSRATIAIMTTMLELVEALVRPRCTHNLSVEILKSRNFINKRKESTWKVKEGLVFSDAELHVCRSYILMTILSLTLTARTRMEVCCVALNEKVNTTLWKCVQGHLATAAARVLEARIWMYRLWINLVAYSSTIRRENHWKTEWQRDKQKPERILISP